MFLTTVRVRRARPSTLDTYLSTRQLQDAKGRRLLEVMAHGQPVAIVDVDDQDVNHDPVVLWRDQALVAFCDDDVVALINPAVGLMAAAHDGGLTSQPEKPEASPKRSRGGRRPERTRS